MVGHLAYYGPLFIVRMEKGLGPSYLKTFKHNSAEAKWTIYVLKRIVYFSFLLDHGSSACSVTTLGYGQMNRLEN